MPKRTRFRRASLLWSRSSGLTAKAEIGYLCSLLLIISSVLFAKAHSHCACHFWLKSAGHCNLWHENVAVVKVSRNSDIGVETSVGWRETRFLILRAVNKHTITGR